MEKEQNQENPNRPIYNSIEFDSKEELEFYHWCEEALSKNIIKGFTYQPDTFVLCDKKTIKVEKQLKTKTKIIEKHLFHPHVYTADFFILGNDKYKNYLNKNLITTKENSFYIDVKGSFQKFDGKRSFSINRKWVYDKFGVYVNEITPKKFFKLTWVPEKVRFTPKQNKPRKAYTKCQTIDQILSKMEVTNS